MWGVGGRDWGMGYGFRNWSLGDQGLGIGSLGFGDEELSVQGLRIRDYHKRFGDDTQYETNAV